jgi:hypothetical protein
MKIRSSIKKALICNLLFSAYFIGPTFVSFPLALFGTALCIFDHPISELSNYLNSIQAEDEEWFMM